MAVYEAPFFTALFQSIGYFKRFPGEKYTKVTIGNKTYPLNRNKVLDILHSRLSWVRGEQGSLESDSDYDKLLDKLYHRIYVGKDPGKEIPNLVKLVAGTATLPQAPEQAYNELDQFSHLPQQEQEKHFDDWAQKYYPNEKKEEKSAHPSAGDLKKAEEATQPSAEDLKKAEEELNLPKGESGSIREPVVDYRGPTDQPPNLQTGRKWLTQREDLGRITSEAKQFATSSPVKNVFSEAEIISKTRVQPMIWRTLSSFARTTADQIPLFARTRTVSNLAGLGRKASVAIRTGRVIAVAVPAAANPVSAVIIAVAAILILLFVFFLKGESNTALCPPWSGCPANSQTPPGQNNSNVTISKTGPPGDHVNNDEEIRYNLKVTFSGQGSGNIEVIDQAPTGTTLKDVFDGGSKDGQTAKWALNNLLNGQSRTVSFSVQPTQRNFWAVNNAQARVTGGSGGSGQTGPLQITKTADKAQYNVGDQIEYTIAVKASSLAGDKVTIKEQIPNTTSFVSADSDGRLEGATVIWDLTALKNAPADRIIPDRFAPAPPPGFGRPVQRITATAAQIQVDLEKNSMDPDVRANAAHFADVLYKSGVGNGSQDQLVDPALLAAIWWGETHYNSHGAYVNNPFSLCFISEGALGGMKRGISNGLCDPADHSIRIPWATWDTFDQGLSAMAENIRTRYYPNGQTDTWTIHSGKNENDAPQFHCRCHIGQGSPSENQIRTWTDYVNFYYGWLGSMDRITGGGDFQIDTKVKLIVKADVDKTRVTNQALGFAPGIGDSTSNNLSVNVGTVAAGATVAIDPGHAFPDPDTTQGKSEEGHLNFEVATRLKEKLALTGINAVLTRDTPGMSEADHYKNLLSRNQAINRSNACFFVSVHFDSNDYRDPTTRRPNFNGASGYINASRPFSQTNSRVATTIAKSLEASTGIPSTHYTGSDLQAGGACANGRIVPLYLLGSTGDDQCVPGAKIEEATKMPGTLMEFFTNTVSYDSIRTNEDLMNKIVNGYSNGITQLVSEICASGPPPPPPPPPPGPVTPTIIRQGNQGKIALTFDLGEGQYGTGGWTAHMHANTKKILDDLKKLGVKATFFPTGAFLEDPNNSDLVQQMIADGHEFGNHTYDHKSATGLVDATNRRLSPEELVAQIEKTETIMNQKFNITTKPYFRFPFFDGATDSSFNNAIAQAGYYNVFWTNCTPRGGGKAIESDPVTQANSEAYINNLTTDPQCISPGSQIVVHGYPDLTAENIGTVVDILKSRGLDVTTISNFWRPQ